MTPIGYAKKAGDDDFLKWLENKLALLQSVEKANRYRDKIDTADINS